MVDNNRTQNSHLQLVRNRECQKLDCSDCEGELFCLAHGLENASIDDFRSIIKDRGPFKAGDFIYRQQDPFHAIFAIQTGCVKTETVTPDGRLAVTGFHMAGDLLGVDNIGSSIYHTDAIAIDNTTICEIPYQRLLKTCSHHPDLQSRFIDRLGSKIHSDEHSWKIVRNESAGRRILFFLYQCFDRQKDTAPNPLRIHLPMSKQDLASFLGLTPESFSRSLTDLQQKGLVTKEAQRTLLLTSKPMDDEITHLSLPESI